ncbi:cytochrome c [Massilia sp. YIM B02763]|uniref:c-type cytochrome n=1 Tax=Massilia sp. YIM B02763 TaxID=3050130 RepID=UPI0025B62D83|nr:cytochrome c [Massilia sp. YIM B02763]MDN4051721.1 cytochrome c [Massilia sp. YIM B02763]
MSSPKHLLACAALAIGAHVHAAAPDAAAQFGRAATPAEVKSWNIDVLPDGTGLPDGKGSVAQGKKLFEANCAACHGAGGVGGTNDRLVGGVGSLATDHPIKTVGSYWPYATTLYDYIRRAMPYQAPGSLSDSDYYALAAYLLNANGVVPANTVLDRHTLPKVKMPNRDGFVPEPEFRTISNARMKK